MMILEKIRCFAKHTMNKDNFVIDCDDDKALVVVGQRTLTTIKALTATAADRFTSPIRPLSHGDFSKTPHFSLLKLFMANNILRIHFAYFNQPYTT